MINRRTYNFNNCEDIKEDAKKVKIEQIKNDSGKTEITFKGCHEGIIVIKAIIEILEQYRECKNSHEAAYIRGTIEGLVGSLILQKFLNEREVNIILEVNKKQYEKIIEKLRNKQ